jgi:hypothetical protein
MVKRKKFSSLGVNHTGFDIFTQPTTQQTRRRMLSASNAGWGTLVLALSCSMCQPPTVPIDIPRCAMNMGKYVAMGEHDRDGQCNLDQQINHQQHPCCSHRWSYIRELFPNLCSAVFVLECSAGCGRIVGYFSESLLVDNAYRGELLGLMAIHLILLSINKLHCNLAGSVEIVSNCLGALKRVTYLPPYRIPSQCHHSDILNNILVHCRDLSFMTYYSHIRAHQDDNTSFNMLSQKAQLNSICNYAAKQRIATDGIEGDTPGRMFPLKPIGLFVHREKMTSKTRGRI